VVAGILAIAVTGGGAPRAVAGLRETPPNGLALTGSWQLDTAKSDDAAAVIDQARDALIDARPPAEASRGAGRWDHGEGGFPGGGGGGGMTRGTIGGAGLGGGGTFGRNADPDSSDPLAGGGDALDGPGARAAEAARNAVLRELEKNPETLVFRSVDHEVRVLADQDELACEAGPKVTMQDGLGDGERQCGWDGRAWVVETSRSRGGTRTDRYELSRDGKVLTYTTRVVGDRMPRIKLMRVYRRPPPPPPA
jgi:hypothetical protein